MRLTQRVFFFSAIVILHLFFFFEAINRGHGFTKDSYEYLQQAKNIRDHHSWYCGDFNFPVLAALYSQRPPGYGVFIAAIKKINNNIWFLFFLQNLLSIFNIYLLCLLIKLLNVRINLLWLLIPLLFFPSQFIYANLIMSEMLLQTTLMLAFYFLVRFILLKEVSAIWLYQVFIVCALLIKPVWYLFPFASILFFIYLIMKKKQAVLKIHPNNLSPSGETGMRFQKTEFSEPPIKARMITTHLIPLAVIAGIFVHNHQQTNYWEYSSIQRKLMVNYNVYEVLAHDLGKEEAAVAVVRMQDAAAVKTTYAEQAAFLQYEINRVLIKHPLTFAWIELKGVVRFFSDHCRYDIESFISQIPSQQTSWWDSYAAYGWKGMISHFKHYKAWYIIYLTVSVVVNAFLFLCLFVFLKQKNIDAAIRIILFVLIIYTALLTGPTGTTRFRLPIYPLLLIAFAGAIPLIHHWIREVVFKRESS